MGIGTQRISLTLAVGIIAGLWGEAGKNSAGKVFSELIKAICPANPKAKHQHLLIVPGGPVHLNRAAFSLRELSRLGPDQNCANVKPHN